MSNLRARQRAATADELALFEGAGTGRDIDCDDLDRGDRRRGRSRLQLKAVDGAYPLYGALILADGRTVGVPAAGDAWIDAALAKRVPVGSSFRLGTKSFRAAGVIADEPDRLGEGFSLGPVVMVGLRGPARDRADAAGQPVRNSLPDRDRAQSRSAHRTGREGIFRAAAGKPRRATMPRRGRGGSSRAWRSF